MIKMQKKKYIASKNAVLPPFNFVLHVESHVTPYVSQMVVNSANK